MKIATFYYHDLKRVWDSKQNRYVERTYEQFQSLFAPILNRYCDVSISLRDYLEKYMLHYPPANLGPSEDDLDDAVLQFTHAQLWIQCTKYLCDEKATTFNCTKQLFDDLKLVDEIWNEIQDDGFYMNHLPYLASVTIELTSET